MKIKYVTITGIDESIQPNELVPLTEKYPFVEWGILFSKNKQGLPRYPDNNWIERLRALMFDEMERPMGVANISCHICGEWTRDILGGVFDINQTHHVFNTTDRIQLNMSDSDFMSLELEKLKSLMRSSYHSDVTIECNDIKFSELSLSLTEALMPKIILQTKRPFERYEELALLNREEFKFQLLYDISGGKGISPNSWAKPVEGVFCGYAGGLNPDNIEEQLNKLAEVVKDNECWIDMETGVRDLDDDHFNLEKVEKCLSIASKWVE